MTLTPLIRDRRNGSAVGVYAGGTFGGSFGEIMGQKVYELKSPE